MGCEALVIHPRWFIMLEFRGFARQDRFLPKLLSLLAAPRRGNLSEVAIGSHGQFRSVKNPYFPDADKDRAAAFYAGHFDLAGHSVKSRTDEVFLQQQQPEAWQEAMHSLAWLHDFAAEPKRLHACFVSRLMAAWCQITPKATDYSGELKRLNVLTNTLPAIASLLNATQQQPLLAALKRQCWRVRKQSPRQACDIIRQQTALLVAYMAHDELMPHTQEAENKLEAALLREVMADGGPRASPLPKYIDAAIDLFDMADTWALNKSPLSPVTLTSIDRMARFIAMFLQSDRDLIVAGCLPLSAAVKQRLTRQ